MHLSLICGPRREFPAFDDPGSVRMARIWHRRGLEPAAVDAWHLTATQRGDGWTDGKATR
jgi:hypothetical protein